MKSALASRSTCSDLMLAVAIASATLLTALPARLAHADEGAPSTEPCERVDGVCDADAGATVQLDDGVIHLDGATGDASADKAAQSGCSVSPASSGAAVWWIPLPFAVGLTLASGRRRRRRARR